MATIRVSRKWFSRHRSIQEAIDRASPGTIIEIEPGLYREELRIDKYVELIGTDPEREVIIQGNRQMVVSMRTGYAVLRRLTLRQPWWNRSEVLQVKQGALIVEDCRLLSHHQPAVNIIGTEAEPILRNCRIESRRSAAVENHSTGKVLFEQCYLSSAGDYAAATILAGNPHFRECTFTGQNGYGVYVAHDGRGLFEQCNFFGFERSPAIGIVGGNPRFVECKIHDNEESGVAIAEGKGKFEKCRFFGFTGELPAVRVAKQALPQFSECLFHDCKGGAFLFEDGSGGLIELCEMYGFTQAPAIEIATKAHPQFLRCRIHDGDAEGVLCTEEGNGLLESCELFGFNSHVVAVYQARLDLLRCEISRGEKHGILMAQKASGVISQTSIHHFAHEAAIHVQQVADPTFKECQIEDAKHGVQVSRDGRGRFEACSFRRIEQEPWLVEQGDPDIQSFQASPSIQLALPEEPKTEMVIQDSMKQLIGQSQAKHQLREQFMYLDYLLDRKKMGIKTTEQPVLDALFLGPADTGKRRMAQIYGEQLQQLGYLASGEVVFTRAKDWLASTEEWSQWEEQAAGGILYIGELHDLLTADPTAELQEWVNHIQQRLGEGDRKTIYVLAGEKGPIVRWLKNQPTLERLLSFHLTFEDYSPQEMAELFHLLAGQEDYTVHLSAYDTLQKRMIQLWDQPGKSSHAERVQRFFQQVKVLHSQRCAHIPKKKRTKEALTTFMAEDLRKRHVQDIQPNDQEWLDQMNLSHLRKR
jgi:hypothetical protein